MQRPIRIRQGHPNETPCPLAPLALLAFVAPALAETKASAWPPKLTFGDGTEASLTGAAAALPATCINLSSGR